MSNYLKSLISILFRSFSFLIILTIYSCTSESNNKTVAEWPSVNQETKPWTRWWWHGSAVTETDLTSNMEELKNAGFGGLEITPIYGVKGYEQEDINFLSSKWMDVFSYTLKEAKRLDLGIDLANASGWPFGGPWVSADDACKNVKYKIYTLTSGEKLAEKVKFIEIPLVRAVGHKVEISEIQDPINTNTNLQELALDQVRFQKELPLQTLIAYGDNNKKINLTNYVNSNGTLEWIAPKGRWKLYAVFQGWHGKMVERAGRGGEGNVIDHFSESAIKNFLNVFDKSAKKNNITGLRAFFNDSYEVDDAEGEANWTPRMFDEFEKLRNYNLKDYLPALFGQDSEENNSRVICDFRETISDLLLSRFTKVWGDWSNSNYNAKIRNQAHGSPANILDLYSASDIPETEGTSPMRIKMATSAGHVSGKKLIACEAATWLNEHFQSNLSDVKKNLDRYLANGVNHIVYHGTPYSPSLDQWPGWLFYASVHFAPTNTWWEDLKTINSYVTNCQSFLQNSNPANDILLYFPIYDSWSNKGSSMLKHFGKQNEELTKEISDYLLTNGFTFDYISDKQIENLKIEGANIVSNDVVYKTIIIPKCEYIPLNTMQKLIKMVNDGANIIFQDNFPNDVPGLYDLQNRQEIYQKLKSEIRFRTKNNYEIGKIGNGKIYKGKNIDPILSEIKIFSESMAKNGVWFNRVLRKEGVCYFITNWSDKDINQWVTINSADKDAVWFDPMNKEFGRAKIRNMSEYNSEVYLKLGKGETLILQWYKFSQEVEEYGIYEPASDPQQLNGEWKIEFVKGGPTLPKPYLTEELKSWTKYNKELTRFSGTAKYKTSFYKNFIFAEAYELNLGEVFESAVIYLNGYKLSTLVGPVFKLTFNSSILQENNILEIYVTNLMANRIIDMERNGDVYKKFYNINFAAQQKANLDNSGLFTAKHWEPLKSGLLGPITITALKQK